MFSLIFYESTILNLLSKSQTNTAKYLNTLTLNKIKEKSIMTSIVLFAKISLFLHTDINQNDYQ